MRHRSTTLALLYAALAAPLSAQTVEAPIRLTSALRAAALDSIRAAFRHAYVFPERREAIAARLTEAERAGRYDQELPATFAARVTEDLRAVTHDLHLALRVDAAAFRAAQRATAAEADAALLALDRERAERAHHGLAELRVLPGNVRYLRISGFHWIHDATGAAYDDAMRFLKGGDAVIIDLRGNGGGDHAAVRYLLSHFMPADSLEMTFLEGRHVPVQSRTLAHLPAGRLLGMPLQVLVDDASASAAEAFAYDVQQFRLGEVIGTKTVGAANNNRMIPVAPLFLLSLSYGRPVHPVSGTNWEGVGVTPTVVTTREAALDAALELALTRLAARPGLDAIRRTEYRWGALVAGGRLRPVTLDATARRTLAGRYGDYVVAEADGALWLSRPGSSRWPARVPLTPLTADGVFRLDGALEELQVRLANGTLELRWPDEAEARKYAKS